MKIIDDLIEMLSSGGCSLEEALLKTKVLLFKLGEKELIKWVDSELNGYKQGDSIPDYRIVPSRVMVTATDGYTTRWNNYPAPLMHLDEEIRETLVRSNMGQSISAIENLVNSETDTVAKHLPTEFCALLSQGLGAGIFAEAGHIEISKSSLLQIVTQVKSRLLSFLLELSESIPDEIPKGKEREVSQMAGTRSLFNNSVFGNNTTVIVGDGNTQTVTISVKKNDFEGLAEILREKGVDDEDVLLLKDAIEQDAGAPQHQDQKFGDNVKRWVTAMMAKAIDSSWQIELNVAANFLSTALMHYYGWLGA